MDLGGRRMSAIAGWVDFGLDLTSRADAVSRMGGAMSGRGRDSTGTCLYRHAAFGYNGLTVGNPACGRQPMTVQCGSRSFAIVFGGALFNTSNLRSELEAKGHCFRGSSDAEVLLHSFVEWDRDCVYKLDGVYAFAIWSEYDQRLFLCRDRLGVKPLFHARVGGGLLFASEPKGLLAHSDMHAELDHEGLAEVFGLGPARTPGHGVYKGMREVRPGFCMDFDREGARHKRYWKLVSRPHPDDLETSAEKVRCLVVDSVRRQLAADVDICTMLSGGLDSSVVTSVAASELEEQGRGNLYTYSVHYEGHAHHFTADDFQPDMDDPWIEQASTHSRTCHRRVTVATTDLFGSLRDAVLARDMPGMADIDSSLLLFIREIRKGAAVALSGECADELFGGYPWFHRDDMVGSDTFPWSRSVSMRARLLSRELREAIDLERYVERRYRETLDEVPRLIGESGLDARIREVFYLTISWFMTTLLDRNDRMSSAEGLEVRAPFCDHLLAEYVWNIPWEMKNCGGVPKGILRRAFAGSLPGEVLARRKSPYPKTHDPEYYALCRDLLLEILSDRGSPLSSLVDSEYIRQVIASGGHAFRQPWFGQLMTDAQLLAYLIQVDAWLREYRVSLC